MRIVLMMVIALLSTQAFAKWDDRFKGSWVLIEHNDPNHDGKSVNDTYYDKATAVRNGDSIRYRQKNHYLVKGQWMTSLTEKVIYCQKLGAMQISYDLVPDGAEMDWMKPDIRPGKFEIYSPDSQGGVTIATMCKYVRK